VVVRALFSLVTSAAQWRVMEMSREDKITDRLVRMRGGRRSTDFTVSEHGELPGAADAAVWV